MCLQNFSHAKIKFNHNSLYHINKKTHQYYYTNIVIQKQKVAKKKKQTLIYKPTPHTYRQTESKKETINEEQKSSRPYINSKIPRELLIYKSNLIPPPLLKFGYFVNS